MADLLNAVLCEGPYRYLTIGESLVVGRLLEDENGNTFIADREFLLRLRIKNNDAKILKLQAENAATAAILDKLTR